MHEVKRSTRVAERVRQELSMQLISGAVHHPLSKDMVITRVQVTDDLSLARVFVRAMNTELSEARRSDALQGLERASGFLRSKLGKALHVRRIPTLEFFWDEAIDEATRIEALLAEVRAEDKIRAEDKARAEDSDPDSGDSGSGVPES